MKKMMKRIMASILAIAMCVSAYIAFDGNVAEASQDTLASGDFKMVGASVRFEDESTVNGIRFGIGIKESVYSELDASVKNSIRLLVMPTKLVTGDLEIGETYTNGTATASAIDTAIGTKWELKTYADGNYYVTYVYLYDIDNTCYDIDVTARAYWRADENSSPVYTDAVERSYIYVAEAALNDVAAVESTAYPNAVGTQFSPYTEAQRDALIDVPYEQTANTIWDYVDGAFIKKGTWNGDEFIYDRTIDASKDFTAKFTHKVQAGGISNDNRLVNFGEVDSKNTFEFDLQQKNDTQYQVHFRRIVNGSIQWLKGCDNYWLTGGTTYDFILSVKYTDTQATVVLKGREHDAHTTYTEMFSLTVDKASLVPGNKFGYCLHAESRGAWFEDANDRYQVNNVDSKGNVSLASGASIEELSSAIRVSGLTTNGSQTKLMMLNTTTYDKTKYGPANANYALSMDLAFQNFTADSYAGFKLGYYNDVFQGADKEFQLHDSFIRVLGTQELQLSSYMTEAQLNAYKEKITSGKAVNFKVLISSVGSQGNEDDTIGWTTASFFIDGIFCGTSNKFDDGAIWEDRCALITNTNATFSNLKIGTNSFPVKAAGNADTALQDGVVVEEISDTLQVSGYAEDGAVTFCTLLNKYATADKDTYTNNDTNFTLTMDVKFEKFTDTSFAGFTVGYYNEKQGGQHTHIRMTAVQIGSDNTKYVDLNATTMGDDGYATYLSNFENGVANTLKVEVDTDDTKTTTKMTFYVNDIKVGEYSIDANKIWQNRIALTTNTNATFSNLVISY